MKNFHKNFVWNLPRVIVLGIAIYNFAWASWQNLQGCMGIMCPWYIIGEFHYPQFFLLIAAFLFFISRIWSYAISALISGYFAIIWGSMVVSWIRRSENSFARNIEIILSQFDGNPLQIWESQVAIAMTISGFAVYFLINQKSTKILN